MFEVIYEAIMRGDLQRVRIWIQQATDLNLRNGAGDTILHMLAWEDSDVNIAAAKLLLENGASPNLQNHRGETPLHIAATQANPPMVDLLLAAKDIQMDLKDHQGNTPLWHVIIWHVINAYKIIQADKIIKALLNHGANPNICDENENTPLHHIVSAVPNTRRHRDIAAFFLEKGANPNLQNKLGLTPLHSAVCQSHLEMVELLLKSENIRLDLEDAKFGMTPLFCVALAEVSDKEKIDMFKKLLEYGAQLDAKNKDGNTLLHTHALLSELNLVRMLIEEGHFEVDVRNTAGETPLLKAIEYGLTDTAEYLIEKGADVNAQNPAGKTPFSLALTMKNPKCAYNTVRFFLQNKGDCINWQDEEYRKRLLEDAPNEKVKKLLISGFQLRTTWDLWVMETPDYTSYLQWLPRELMEDNQNSFFKGYRSGIKRKRTDEEEVFESEQRRKLN